MPPTSETVSRQTLQGLGNIANLSPQAFEELATKIHIETQPAGRRLFIRGRRDNWIYYLLQGSVRLDYLDNRSEEIRSNTNEARKPLAGEHEIRQATATTLSEIHFIRIDANLLEVLSQEISPNSYQLEEYTVDDEEVSNRLFFNLYNDYLNDCLKLPQLPNVALKVKQIADDPEGDIRTMARIIQTSPVLPGQLILTANSALYQLQAPVNNTLAAVSILGMRKTRDLVITYTMRNLFRTKSNLIAERMQRLWRHCALTGAISYALADMTPGLEPDRALLLGLLHDIGVLPVLHYAGQLSELTGDPQQLEQALQALRGQIGAMILRTWGFLDETIQVCLDAENWHRDPGDRPDYTDAILIAQRLADSVIDKQPPMENVSDLPAFNKLARGRLNDEELLEELLNEAQNEIAAVFQLN